MEKITLTLEQLESLLNQQKHETAKYITRNLSVYSFFGCLDLGNVSIDTTKFELNTQCDNSPFPDEFNILKKYLSK